MALFDFGKGGGSSTTTVQMTPEQQEYLKLQTDSYRDTFLPAYKGAVGGATDIYNKNAPGVLNAAQNQARTAMQAQESLGGTGESALRTGISGLQSLFNPDYERTQIQAAIAPAQAQYAQNLEMQQRQFGGSGNLGSARQALADRQLAGATQSAQMQAAANIQQQIAGQRAGVGAQLANFGQSGIGQALGASGNAVSASMVPLDFYNKYSSVIFGTPAGSYTPDFRGTQGSSTNSSNYKLGFGL